MFSSKSGDGGGVPTSQDKGGWQTNQCMCALPGALPEAINIGHLEASNQR